MTTLESLLSEIIREDKILADMLSSRDPVEALRMTATLDSLSSYGKHFPNSDI